MSARLLVAALVAILVAACAKPDAGTAERTDARAAASSAAVVDDVLLAYLSTARSLHHEADLFEDKSDLRGAIGALERLVDKPAPRQAPEIDEVVADTRARLGDLRSQLGDFDAAAKDVELGLQKTPAVSYFRGHLLEVRGLVEQRRAKALEAKGDVDGAAKAKASAMKSFEEAIAVQDEVIRRALGDAGAP
jgi:tetratricopeptide (TPR) repeat protein